MASSSVATTKNVGKLSLVGDISNYGENVLVAVGVPHEDGVICLSEDRTIKVYIKRSNGQYWPSISNNLPAMADCMEFYEDLRQIFVGLENGSVMEFEIAEDYNSLTHIRNYAGHESKITGIVSVPESKHVTSCSTDRSVTCHSTSNGSLIGSFRHQSPCSAIQFDSFSSSWFVGDTDGRILLLSPPKNGSLSKTSVLQSHTGTVQQFAISTKADRQLISAGRDGTICVHDIKTKEFKLLYKLVGHKGRVQSIFYNPSSNVLFSVGDELIIICWDLGTSREMSAVWNESDKCEICSVPFYWNIKSMWEEKTIGVRQHHCRQCGKALCAKCSGKTITIPKAGFEIPVRVCDACYDEVTTEKQSALASFSSITHSCSFVHYDGNKHLLFTTGKDKTVKIWDAQPLLTSR